VWPEHWPVIARQITTSTESALAAASDGAADAFRASVDDLAALPYEQVGAVHAGVARELLEEPHPDGLTGEDVQAVLERTVRAGLAWYPELAPDAVVSVLTGTLGVSDPDAPQPTIAPVDHLAAAVLVLADLLAARRVAARPYLRRAVGEIERGETMEMP